MARKPVFSKPPTILTLNEHEDKESLKSICKRENRNTSEVNGRWEISLTKKAQKTYEDENSSLLNKLNRCFEQLRDNPHSHPNIKRLHGKLAGKFRYRLGDWRVIYSINEENQLVIISIIAARGEVYER
jgi:mRNA interferase RelE/StbE